MPKKKPAKKRVKKSKKSCPKKLVLKKPNKLIAKVDHYFDKISVASFRLQAPLKVGDEVWFKGAHVDFVQRIESIQINHQRVARAKKGQEVGIKVCQKINEGVVLLPAKLRPQAEKSQPTVIAKPLFPMMKPSVAPAAPTLPKRVMPLAKPNKSDSYGGTKFLSF
ncbi:hypothetical protein COT42_02605 [Candidatus Saganbacteria bacterium CG08_land_8_20_14_0_20_45_16]|uniref:Translation elongation factor-like protein n=1 Tax=Candidatus Saganbacteria bacterium CG08_land_8_20_14_0_20_45_16 TaxID=2014293 RepID=A0A2H0Y087_UNCSA|nr:MAG: hypothetical protein COT42_02605 [Candidatus Saganbacteria bacterium CG08_land_8_20_14_0_20_45_16]